MRFSYFKYIVLTNLVEAKYQKYGIHRGTANYLKY